MVRAKQPLLSSRHVGAHSVALPEMKPLGPGTIAYSEAPPLGSLAESFRKPPASQPSAAHTTAFGHGGRMVTNTASSSDSKPNPVPTVTPLAPPAETASGGTTMPQLFGQEANDVIAVAGILGMPPPQSVASSMEEQMHAEVSSQAWQYFRHQLSSMREHLSDLQTVVDEIKNTIKENFEGDEAVAKIAKETATKLSSSTRGWKDEAARLTEDIELKQVEQRENTLSEVNNLEKRINDSLKLIREEQKRQKEHLIRIKGECDTSVAAVESRIKMQLVKMEKEEHLKELESHDTFEKAIEALGRKIEVGLDRMAEEHHELRRETYEKLKADQDHAEREMHKQVHSVRDLLHSHHGLHQSSLSSSVESLRGLIRSEICKENADRTKDNEFLQARLDDHVKSLAQDLGNLQQRLDKEVQAIDKGRKNDVLQLEQHVRNCVRVFVPREEFSQS